MRKISCIIIEDQAPARQILEHYISDTPALKLVGTFVSAIDAFDVVSQQQVGAIFLDLQLPKIDGFAFLRSLPNPPKTIVTTADPGHALEGYDLNVVDYLLKPFSYDRFLSAVSKLRAALAAPSNATPPLEDIFIKSHGEIVRIPIAEIEFARSDGDYVELFAQNQKHYFLQPLKVLESLLPEARFCRVHRSYIVNLGRIIKIVDQEIAVAGTNIPIGRSYKKTFLQKLNAMG